VEGILGGEALVREERQAEVSVAEGSVLFVSAHIDPLHKNYAMYRPKIDPPPDFDLNRLVETAGQWTRRYFSTEIIDAPSDGRVYPKDPGNLSAVVIAASLHYWSDARGALAPWQDELMHFVRKSILDWDLGFLGLCGGAQIGLRALGGRVEPNPPGLGCPVDYLEENVLVRVGELVLTDDGLTDPIFFGCPARFEVLEAHGDYLAGVPDHMKVLARSPDLPNQVLGWEDRVRLFQPHPEMSLSLIRRVLHELSGRTNSPAERRRLGQISKRLRETDIANKRIVPNFLRML
jgi:GMP synthase-like glutamine amidotransferase